MGKKKTFAALLAVTALLVAGAFFPKIISEMLDRSNAGMPSYHHIPSLQFHLNAEQPALTALEELALLGCGTTVDITPDQATMTEDAVQKAVDSCMVEYEKAGIFQWFEPAKMWIQPRLVYDPADFERHLVIWTVTMIGGEDPEQVLLLDIHDETGNILCISYDVYDAFSMEGVWERNRYVMEALTGIYFSQLGLQNEVKAIGSANADNSQFEYKEVDGGTTEVIYTFEDDIFGAFHIQFNVDGSGGFATRFYQ